MMNKIFILLIIGVLSAFSPDKTRVISGRIFSALDSTIISGATVLVTGTKIECATDEKGYYKINLPLGKSEISVRMMGFIPKTKQIGVSSKVDIGLEATSLDMNEIVVTAYGSTRRETTICILQANIREIKKKRNWIQRVIDNIEHAFGLLQVENNELK